MRVEMTLSGEELTEAIANYIGEKKENINIIHVASMLGKNKTSIEIYKSKKFAKAKNLEDKK